MPDEDHAPASLDPENRRPKTPQTPSGSGTDGPEPKDRDAMLREELAGVRKINESVEGMLATLGKAGDNMEVVFQTVRNASTLLDTWSRILSQTEHNQRLVLHPDWQGATEDLARQEAEALEKQREAERKAAEEEERREERRRRQQEEEDRRRLGAATSTRGTRRVSRARGSTDRGTTQSRGTTQTRGATQTRSTASSRYGFGIGRGRAATSGGRVASGTGRGETRVGRGRSRAAR